jgi:anti-sigma B factor antagonist
MEPPSAKLLVLAGKQFACIKIIGRANFNSSLDFQTLVTELRARDYCCFVIDLTDCVLLDSTFLGVLAGFGLKLRSAASGPGAIPADAPDQRATLSQPESRPEAPAAPASGQNAPARVTLLNPNPRVLELLENLGVSSLFDITQGELSLPESVETTSHEPAQASREALTRACLEAHQTLMALNPENVARFKDVARFLAEDLARLRK